jgi:hypothetical protein
MQLPLPSVWRTFGGGVVRRRGRCIDCALDHFRRRSLWVEDDSRGLELGNMTALSMTFAPASAPRTAPWRTSTPIAIDSSPSPASAR